MAKFAIGKPQTTTVATISVDGGTLPVGTHRFRLQVVGRSGVPSVADEVLIQVVDGTTIPTRPSGTIARLAPTPQVESAAVAKPATPRKTGRKSRSKT